MKSVKQVIWCTLFGSLAACGGGGGGVDSEVVRVETPVVDPVEEPATQDPVDPGVAEPILPEDVVSTDQLVAPDSLQLKPSKAIVFKVDLPSSYGESPVVLCVADAPLTSTAQIDFDNCMYAGHLSGGQLEVELRITNTVPYIAGAVLSEAEDHRLLNWQAVQDGQTLLISSSI